jgi:hypothetical protein
MVAPAGAILQNPMGKLVTGRAYSATAASAAAATVDLDRRDSP